jgi:cobalamin biosynthesis protein CbiD
MTSTTAATAITAAAAAAYRLRYPDRSDAVPHTTPATASARP